MKKLSILFVLATISFASYSQDSYEKALKDYLDACGSMAAFKPIVSQMISSFKGMYSTVPNEFWDEFEKEFSSSSLDDLVRELTPVYKKHLTEADLKEITKFYSTPIGKKLASKTPAITNDSMQAGQSWGQAIAKKVADKMKEKGY